MALIDAFALCRFPIYSLYYISDTLFASGDDEGVVKVN